MSEEKREDTLPEGYRMTELGPLPEEWRVVKLGEVFEEVIERVEDSNWPKAVELPVLSLTKNEGLILQSERFGKRIATEDISKYKVVRRGQIVYNPYVIWEGAIHILDKYEAGIVSPVYPVLSAKRSLADPYFFDAWLRTPPAIAAYNRFAAGVVNRRRAIRKRDFWQIVAPLPPLPEQKAIAYVLRTVQEAKEATEKVISSLRELKKSLMKHLFTYGPVPVEERDKVELKDTEIGKIPAHWKVVRLGEVFEIHAGGDIDKLNWSPFKTEKFVYPIYSNSLANDGLYGFADTYKFQENSITVTGRGNLGYAVPRYEKFNAIIRLLVLVPKSDIDIKFVAEYINGFIRVNLEGSSIPQLTRPKIAKYSIPLPPLEEQHQIARILQTVDQKIEAEKKRKQALENLFKSLLHNLMTAKVRLPREFVRRFEEEG